MNKESPTAVEEQTEDEAPEMTAEEMQKAYEKHGEEEDEDTSTKEAKDLSAAEMATKEREERVKADEQKEEEQAALRKLEYEREKTGWFLRKLKTPAKIAAVVTSSIVTVPFIPFSKKVWGSLFSGFSPKKSIINLGNAIKEEYKYTYEHLFGPLPKKSKNLPKY
jgi:HD-GYP domain-containing protein (c-di-GMP phosphodiesterase class II)